MISIEDMEAWREDEKQTQFIEEQKLYVVKHKLFGIPHNMTKPLSRKRALDDIALFRQMWPSLNVWMEEVK